MLKNAAGRYTVEFQNNDGVVNSTLTRQLLASDPQI